MDLFTKVVKIIFDAILWLEIIGHLFVFYVVWMLFK